MKLIVVSGSQTSMKTVYLKMLEEGYSSLNLVTALLSLRLPELSL